MIYLILKMFVYLLLATGVGGVAGWLLRNLQAQQGDEQARRKVADAKSKVPQLESLLRGRDEQIVKLKNEISERRKEQKDLSEQIKAGEKALLEQRQEANKWKHAAEAKRDITIDGEGDDTADNIIAELSQEIMELKGQLAQHNTGDSSPGSFQQNEAEYVKRQELLMAELDAARLQTSQLEKQIRSTKTDLDRTTNTVNELERERELQNKSLHVLHQQLANERSNRMANG